MPLILRCILAFRDVKMWRGECFRIKEKQNIFQRIISQVTNFTKDELEEGIKYLHLGQLSTLVS